MLKNKFIAALSNNPFLSALFAGTIVQTISIVYAPWHEMNWFQIFLLLSIFLFIFVIIMNFYRFSHTISINGVNSARNQLSREFHGYNRFSRIYDYFIRRSLKYGRRLLGEPPSTKHPFTSFAFDRCLAFALVYPLLTAIIVWAADSRSIGAIGMALGLPNNIELWQRIIFIMSTCLPAALLALRIPKSSRPYRSPRSTSNAERDPRALTDEELEERALSFALFIGLCLIVSAEFVLFSALIELSARTMSLIFALQAIILIIFTTNRDWFGIGLSLLSVSIFYSMTASGLNLGDNASYYAPPFIVLSLILFLATLSYNEFEKRSRKFRLSLLFSYLLLFIPIVFTSICYLKTFPMNKM